MIFIDFPFIPRYSTTNSGMVGVLGMYFWFSQFHWWVNWLLLFEVRKNVMEKIHIVALKFCKDFVTVLEKSSFYMLDTIESLHAPFNHVSAVVSL